MAKQSYFTGKTFKFIEDLTANNTREWFAENKQRYEDEIRTPALSFIEAFAPRLKQISKHFRADARKAGGSLFRIHRDVRFSKDKSPYKTHTGIHFRHEQAKDAHAPGFYLHLEPGTVFVGLGIWRPPSDAVKQIREYIVADPTRWKRVLGAKAFKTSFTLEGDALKRPPRGFDPEHPLVEDLKRKDFIGVVHLRQKQVTSAAFMEQFVELCKAGAPLQKFLCQALGVKY